MKIYENIKEEWDRIQKCIQKYGWTSDHNLGWFSSTTINDSGRPVFVEFEDGAGALVHAYPREWHVWSDPLCDIKTGIEKIDELATYAFKNGIDCIWFDYISDGIHQKLSAQHKFDVKPIDYSLNWPVLKIDKLDLALPGKHFKDIRNARNKFYREHKVEVVDYEEKYSKAAYDIIDSWKIKALAKEESKYVYDSWYYNLVDNNFHDFKTARILLIDNKPVGFNAGYDVPNNPGRFGGAVGIHNYSVKELGLMLWLEDLGWVKNAGYSGMDMQGDEVGSGGLKFKMQFNPVIERKTDTFSIVAK